jgi:hypothetical protein
MPSAARHCWSTLCPKTWRAGGGEYWYFHLRKGRSLRPLGGFGRNWCVVVVAVVGKMQSLWSDRVTPVARTADILLFAVLWEQGTRRKEKE